VPGRPPLCPVTNSSPIVFVSRSRFRFLTEMSPNAGRHRAGPREFPCLTPLRQPAACAPFPQARDKRRLSRSVHPADRPRRRVRPASRRSPRSRARSTADGRPQWPSSVHRPIERVADHGLRFQGERRGRFVERHNRPILWDCGRWPSARQHHGQNRRTRNRPLADVAPQKSDGMVGIGRRLIHRSRARLAPGALRSGDAPAKCHRRQGRRFASSEPVSRLPARKSATNDKRVL
jgi:hypothetical protein